MLSQITPKNQSLSLRSDDEQQILNYLKNHPDWVEEVLLAAELNLSLPALRQSLNQLLEQKLIESNEDSRWRKIPEANNCQIDKREIIIDSQLQSLIPALQKSELFQLETSILKYGIRDPLVVWAGQNILLDGHNRYALAQKYSLPFQVVEIELADKNEAIVYMIDNQLSRRNLTSQQLSYLRGRRYHCEKTSGHGAQSAGHFDPQIETAEKLASIYKVAPRTIKRDASYTQAVDEITQVLGDEFFSQVMNHDLRLTKKATHSLAVELIT